jgi:hypothetical protein
VHSRASPHDGVGGLGAAADQVLAVVQHDQAFGVTEGVSERVRRRAAGVADAEGRRDLPQNERRFGDWSELDPGGAIAEAVSDGPHDFGGQAGFTASAGSGERHEPSAHEEVADRGDLALAADEGCERRGKLRAGRTGQNGGHSPTSCVLSTYVN